MVGFGPLYGARAFVLHARPELLAGYRIEVNGKLFAANGMVDANPQLKLIESREKLQQLMPEYQVLQSLTTLKDDEQTRLAALHAQAYGEAVDAEKLIPHMLEAFMAGDRGFRKGTATRSAPSKPT